MRLILRVSYTSGIYVRAINQNLENDQLAIKKQLIILLPQEISPNYSPKQKIFKEQENRKKKFRQKHHPIIKRRPSHRLNNILLPM